MTRQFVIRPCGPDDQVAAKALVLNGLGEHFGFIDPTKNPDLDDIAASYLTAGSDFLVAERDGALVGTGALISEGDSDGRLVRMSVSSRYRRLGIGRSLVQELLRLARARGYRRVWVETNLDWDDAMALYRACGFQEHHSDDESVHMAIKL